MKNQWLVWAFIAGVIIVVVVAFNSEKRNKTVDYAGDVPAEVQYEEEVSIEKAAATAVKDSAKAVQEAVETAKTNAGAGLSKTETAVAQATADISDFTGVAYTIQIGSVKELKDAQRLLADVIKKGHAGYIVKRDLGEKGIWYRVYIGQFDTKQEADDDLSDVQKDFPSAFVIVPSKKNS